MIKTRDLRCSYSPDLPDILKGINLTIQDGSFTVIMGSNGSGKSTLARCLNGLLVPTAGSVEVGGVMTDDPVRKNDVRRNVGLVFQDPNCQMTSMTIERELAFGLENAGMPTDEMHALVGDYLRMFGFEERRNDPPSSLSGGEKQRLAIASVMILNPTYLILDEATSLLSALSRKAVMDMVLALRNDRGVTAIHITQFSSEALLCDRLIVLHEGSIVMDDVPENVFRHGEALLHMGVSIPLKDRLRIPA